MIIEFHREETQGLEEYIKEHGRHFTLWLATHVSRLMLEHSDCQAISLSELPSNIPEGCVGDMIFLSNMALSDFFPSLLNREQCVKYALCVINDPDGYEGMPFMRWIVDNENRENKIDLRKFV